MIKKLIPDRIFENFGQITPEYLIGNGIEALLLDIDNTLVTYDDEEPTEAVIKWLEAMKGAGIKISFVSNNSSPARVEKFNEKLGFFAVSRAKKPLTHGFKRALDNMGVKPHHAASLGDQIFTDVWAARNIGAHAFLVPPIKDKTTLFFKAKRLLEKPLIKKYRELEKTGKIHTEKQGEDK